VGKTQSAGQVVAAPPVPSFRSRDRLRVVVSLLMGRADRERMIAEQERSLAQVERKLVENRDRNELTHFRAMHTHERAAEIHDALADFYPDADD